MTNHRSSMRILTVLAVLTAGTAAFASGATAATEGGSRGQAAETKQATAPKKGAPENLGHAEPANCVCAGLQAPLVPDHGG